MSIDDLSKNLDHVIRDFERDAGNACQYCDETTGDALVKMREANVKALSMFKAELLTYLSQN